MAWSTAGLFVRLIPLDAMSMVVWRGPAAALGVLAVIAWTERGRTLAAFAAMGAAAWTYAVLAGLGMLIYVGSLRLTTVAHVAFIYATVPFAAAALGYLFLRELPSRSALIACALALVGVGVMVATPDAGSSLLGDLMAAGVTVMTAGMMVLSRRFPGIPMLPAACMSGVLAGLAALPLATQLPANAGELGLIAASGVINMSLGLGLLAVGARLLPAVEAALIGTLESPLAPLWVWLAFGETPGQQTLLGGALVIIAVLGHLWFASRRPAA